MKKWDGWESSLEKEYALLTVDALQEQTECWLQCDEVAVARGCVQLSLGKDVFGVIVQYLHPQCSTEEQLQQLAVVGSGDERESVFRSTYLDRRFATKYFTNGLEHVYVGVGNWSQFLLKSRTGFPGIGARMLAVDAHIPKHIDDVFFDVMDGDLLTDVFCAIVWDALYAQYTILPKLKRRLPPHLFEKQICTKIEGGTALCKAIYLFAENSLALDFDYLALLVPSESATCVPLKASLYMQFAFFAFHGSEITLFDKSLEVMKKLTGFTFGSRGKWHQTDTVPKISPNIALRIGAFPRRFQQKKATKHLSADASDRSDDATVRGGVHRAFALARTKAIIRSIDIEPVLVQDPAVSRASTQQWGEGQDGVAVVAEAERRPRPSES